VRILADTDKERVFTLVQALRLVKRHLYGMSGLTDKEMKDYINTILKVY
jgi:hypothetical protein